jgi:hypothetical protein
MHFCASLACALLAVTVSVPASAGGRKGDRQSDALVVLRGDLLEAGELGAPFVDPGPAVGSFVLRSSRRGDLRVDPRMAWLKVSGGELRARATDPMEARGGFIDLCALGMSPFPCATTLPFRPEPTPLPPNPLIPLHTDPIGLRAVQTDQQQALLGCGSYYGTVCDGTTLLPGVDPNAGNGIFGRRDFEWIGTGPDGEFERRVHPLVVLPGMRAPAEPSTVFRSEIEALSWNALMALVALSTSEGPPANDELDPSDPFRTDGCSFANPFACTNVSGFLDLSAWRFNELPDDPRGGQPERWLWESAIAYDVVHARGELADFLDGRLYVYGPFESPIDGSASGVGLLLVPPPDAVPDATSPLMRVAPGLDRVFGTEDDSVVGFAWGAASSSYDGVTKRWRKPRGRSLGVKAGPGKVGPAGRGRGRP